MQFPETFLAATARKKKKRLIRQKKVEKNNHLNVWYNVDVMKFEKFAAKQKKTIIIEVSVF